MQPIFLLLAGAPLDDCKRFELMRELSRAADCYEREAKRFGETSRSLAVEAHQSAARCHLARGKWRRAERSLRWIVGRSSPASYDGSKAALLLLERDFQKEIRRPKHTAELISSYEHVIARGHPEAANLGIDRIALLYRRIGRSEAARSAEHRLEQNRSDPWSKADQPL